MAVPEMGVLHIFSIPLCTSRPLTTDVKMSKTSCFLRREAKQRKPRTRRRPWKWRKTSWMVMRFLEKQRNPEKWREKWRNVRIMRFQSQDSRIQEKGVLHEGFVRRRPRKNAKEFNLPPKVRRWKRHRRPCARANARAKKGNFQVLSHRKITLPPMEVEMGVSPIY